ncbi:MAG TPA: hypothetical protein VMD53_17325 [Rhizomicrobium sp.]|nr:hypothetical protein [Rhizomicrobium sp.]
MSGWREIGMAIAGMVAKEPPYIQIAIGLSAAFVALMLLEGLRASFIPRHGSGRSAGAARPRFTAPHFRSAPGNVAKLPRNPKRPENIVKPHRAPKPTIRRNTAKAPENSEMRDLPQVSSFGD